MAYSAYATSSVIPFDTGRSYVVRSLPLERCDYRFEDGMGRTAKDKAFLKQFETIFLAASRGDLASCKKVVSEGFCDFNAYSVGHFGTTANTKLDNVSPLQIAQGKGHTEIVDFFQKCIRESSLKNNPQPREPELNPYFQFLDDCMKDLCLNLPHPESITPKAKPSTPEILDQSPNHVFLKKPNTIQINEEGETRYAISLEVGTLIEELKEKGPLIALGEIGPGCYVNDPSELQGEFCGEKTYGWKQGATRKESSKQNYLLILGAKKDGDRGLVYFVLSQDVTANQDSCIRQHKPSHRDNKIYAVSHKTFKDYLSQLYPCTSFVQNYAQTLCSMPLDSILKEKRAECKAIGQKAFDEFKKKANGNSIAAKEAVQDICDSLVLMAQDGALRKRYVETAWGGIGDENWTWRA